MHFFKCAINVLKISEFFEAFEKVVDKSSEEGDAEIDYLGTDVQMCY